jgi:hypothetical protein
MRNIVLSTIALILTIVIVSLFIYSSEKTDITDKTYQEAFRDNYKIFTPEVPNKINFAGESAPLDLIYVAEKLDREFLINTYWHNSTILLIKRSNRWFPLIEPILKRNNIPNDFKYLALIESGLMNVKSPAGAAGYWQFLEKTGREYGLEVNKEVDERYHVEKATQAACDYLNDSFEEFQDWTLVAAAYNAGNKRIKEAIEKQNTSNYYELYLNEETSRYLYRILAIKTIYEHPTKYGFYLREADLYPQIATTSIEIDSTIPDLVLFAKNNNINYRVLKEFNPWLKADQLPDESGKTYFIKIPKKDYLDTDFHKKQVKDYKAIFNDTIRME